MHLLQGGAYGELKRIFVYMFVGLVSVPLNLAFIGYFVWQHFNGIVCN